MASDWIKVRVDLVTSPKVVRIASALKTDRFRIVGGLLSAWSLFDAHSTDGRLDGYTIDALDETIGFPGLCRAMVSVGWLVEDGESIAMPRFAEHNGQSAKRRAMDSERKRNVREMSACDADKLRTREEKRREELTTSSLRSDVVVPQQPEAPKKGGKRATQLHDDFEPDETAISVAEQLGVSIRAELPKFRDFHASRGKPMKCWQAAFRTWIRNAKQFARPEPRQTDADRRRKWMEDLTGRQGDEIRTIRGAE